jgi:hypothetical protein
VELGGLEVIVSWEGERDWGKAGRVGSHHELGGGRGWDGPVSVPILPQGTLGGIGGYLRI